jgi:hypothetical protein
LNLIGAQCEMGSVDDAALQRAQAALRSSRTAGRLYYEWISEAIERVKRGEACDGLGATEIEALIGAMEQNPNSAHYRGWRQDNLGLRAFLAIAKHDPRTALEYLEQSVAASPDGSIALAQAAQLGSAGYPAEGLALLDYYDSLTKPEVSWTWSMASLHAWVLRRQICIRRLSQHPPKSGRAPRFPELGIITPGGAVLPFARADPPDLDAELRH